MSVSTAPLKSVKFILLFVFYMNYSTMFRAPHYHIKHIRATTFALRPRTLRACDIMCVNLKVNLLLPDQIYSNF